MVWIANGVEWESSHRTLNAIKGNTSQSGTPTPSSPKPINCATGAQTITINGTAYPLNLGAIELAEIGTTNERIYPSGAAWYLEKKIAHVIPSSAVAWTKGSYSQQKRIYCAITELGGGLAVIIPNNNTVAPIMSTKYEKKALQPMLDNLTNGIGISSSGYLTVRDDTSTSADNLVSRVTGMDIYYELRTATTTTITDAGLIAQLDAIKAAVEDGGAISITPSGSNLAVVMDAPENGTGGAIWEDSGGIAAQPVTNNGIATASPIWTVNGEAENPTIINETTGQTLTFTGTIPNGQTLVVDCGAQTANIAGVDVKAQISGQWITIEPGTNLIAYSGASTNGPATIKWNEVIE